MALLSIIGLSIGCAGGLDCGLVEALGAVPEIRGWLMLLFVMVWYVVFYVIDGCKMDVEY